MTRRTTEARWGAIRCLAAMLLATAAALGLSPKALASVELTFPADESTISAEESFQFETSPLGWWRVQFATEDDFGGESLVCDTDWWQEGFDTTIYWTFPGDIWNTEVNCGPLAPGLYYWRVLFNEDWPPEASPETSEIWSFTVPGDPPQACDEILYESDFSNAEVTFDLGDEYECGQFANGDWWVVPDEPEGDVVIDEIYPAMITGHHGVDVNPSVTSGNTQPWDDRQPGYTASTITFPYDSAAGDSVVKYVSWNVAEPTSCAGAPSGSCGQFVAVLTVLDEAPEEPSETFRPPYFGSYKPLFSTTDLKLDYLLRLEDDCCDGIGEKLSLADARARTKYTRFDHSPGSTHELEPIDSFEPDGLFWGGDVLKKDTEIVGWLLMEDACEVDLPCSAQEDLDAKTPVLIGYVQYGIDLWGATRAGTSVLKGGGGNGAGKLFTEVFAATMLDNDEMKDDIAGTGPRDFWETFSYYRGSTGLALWGQLHHNDIFAQWETAYWDTLGSGPAVTRDPYGYIDGAAEPGTSYQRSTMMPTKYAALILQLIPEMHEFWPGTHEDVIMEYAERVVEVGAWTQPDPCAPKSGDYGVDYGPNGTGGCIEDINGPAIGRLPLAHGTTQNGSGASRQSAFGNAMWTEYWESLD